MFHKFQTLTYKNGNIYQGNIYNYQPYGEGKLTYKSGATYEGQFQNGLPNGFGKLIIDNQTILLGQFQDGQLKYGKYIDQNIKILGQWHQNECENICALLELTDQCLQLTIGFFLGGEPVGARLIGKQISQNQIQFSMFIDSEEQEETKHILEGNIEDTFTNLNERKLILIYSLIQQHITDKIKIASQILLTCQDLDFVIQTNQKQQLKLDNLEQMKLI